MLELYVNIKQNINAEFKNFSLELQKVNGLCVLPFISSLTLQAENMDFGRRRKERKDKERSYCEVNSDMTFINVDYLNAGFMVNKVQRLGVPPALAVDYLSIVGE